MNGNDTIGSEIALLHNCITEKIITAAPRPEEIEFSVEEWATYCNVANNFLMKTSMNYPIIYIEPEFPTVSNEEQEICSRLKKNSTFHIIRKTIIPSYIASNRNSPMQMDKQETNK